MANIFFATTTASKAFVNNRIILAYDNTNAAGLKCDHATDKNCKISEADPDLILGSFYQSNGDD